MSGSVYCRDSLQKARRDPRLQLLARSGIACRAFPRVTSQRRSTRRRAQPSPEAAASSAWTRCCGKWQAAGVSLLMLAILLGAAMMAAP